MPTFQYRALQTDGSIAEGVLDAPGRPDAFRQIEAGPNAHLGLCAQRYGVEFRRTAGEALLHDVKGEPLRDDMRESGLQV